MSKANTASKAIMLPVSMKSKAFFIRNCEAKPGRFPLVVQLLSTSDFFKWIPDAMTCDLGMASKPLKDIFQTQESPVDGIIELNQSFEKSFINMSVQDRQKLSMAFPKIGRILYKRCYLFQSFHIRLFETVPLGMPFYPLHNLIL